MKKLLTILLACVLACGLLAGCNEDRDAVPQTPDVGSTVQTVGISLPDEVQPRWKNDGEIMKSELEKAGYGVILCYAENDSIDQICQIQDMIKECQLLIVAPVDSGSLSQVIYDAEEAHIPVISYETLIKNTMGVSYCVMFDYQRIGRQIADYIGDLLDIYSSDGPYTLELAVGAPEDEKVERMITGVMDMLQFWVNDGKLAIRSKETDYSRIAAADTEEVRERMNKILSDYYSDGTGLDVIICTDDAVAREVTAIMKERGTGSWPLITGVGCEPENVRNIYNGRQNMSMYLDTSAMALRTAEIAIAMLTGAELYPDEPSTYDNGVKIVPVFLEEATAVNIDNLSYLIEIGAYTREQIFTAEIQ